MSEKNSLVFSSILIFYWFILSLKKIRLCAFPTSFVAQHLKMTNHRMAITTSQLLIIKQSVDNFAFDDVIRKFKWCWINIIDKNDFSSDKQEKDQHRPTDKRSPFVLQSFFMTRDLREVIALLCFVLFRFVLFQADKNQTDDDKNSLVLFSKSLC